MTAHTEWQRCRPWIEAALSRGGDLFSIEDVERDIVDGHAYFWPGKRCAAVTNFIGTKNRAVNFWLLGGDLHELVDHMRPVIETWAEHQGCTRTMGVFSKGRRGWVRVLERFGYAPLSTVLSKELKP